MRISDWSSDVCSSDLLAGRVALEADGIGLYRPVAVTRHKGHDGAGIDATAEKAAERHVADHLGHHRGFHGRAQPLRPVRLPRRVVGFRRDPPVALDPVARKYVVEGASVSFRVTLVSDRLITKKTIPYT